MNNKNRILKNEISEFKKYLSSFYDVNGGIYPIATQEELEEGLNIFLMTTNIEKIEFDSVDREKVRKILNR
tara:strand:- start:317 stop:529 length:213 start_codon:yes stop_codon:yes gene_type:complete